MDKKWLISISLKFMLIFFLPYYLVTGPTLVYSSPLLNLSSTNGAPLTPMELSSIPLVLTFVVVLAVPAAIFDYIAKHRPVEEPIGKLFILVFAFTTPLGEDLILVPVLTILLTTGGPIAGVYGVVSYSISIASYGTIWTMALMVVIPFLMREVRILNPKSGSADTVSGFDIASIVTKYNLLAIVFSVSLFLMPTAMISQELRYFQDVQQHLYILSGAGLFWAAPTRYSLALTFVACTFTSYIQPSILFLSLGIALNIVYVHEVLRYLRSDVSRTRCIGVGLLVTLAMPFTVFMPYQSFGTNVTVVVYPLPIILVLGLLVIWRMKPTEVKQKIWYSEPYHMWYKDKGPMAEGEEVEKIKVPLLYALRSKLGRTGGKKTRYNWDHKEEDAFDDKSDTEGH